jgi:hypothetical protein
LRKNFLQRDRYGYIAKIGSSDAGLEFQREAFDDFLKRDFYALTVLLDGAPVWWCAFGHRYLGRGPRGLSGMRSLCHWNILLRKDLLAFGRSVLRLAQ